MITKLKYLKTWFTRDILPAAGAAIGKILYTSTNTVGRRKQYVIDLDAKTLAVTDINAYPADPKTSPGVVIERSGLVPPQNDKVLYRTDENKLPALIALGDTVTITLAQGASGLSSAIANVLVNDTVNGVTATTTVITIAVVSHDTALTLNTTTGAIDVAASTVPGTYHVVYSITDVNEPTNTATATATIIVSAS